MKFKYLIMAYLSESPVVFTFPLSETHSEVADRLSGKDNPLLPLLKVVSAGEAAIDDEVVNVDQGSQSLGIKRDAEREERDKKLITAQLRVRKNPC